MTIYVNSSIEKKYRMAARGESGLRPSFQAIMRLIDTADPAWPATAAVLREMADAGIEINEVVLVIASKLGAHRFASADAPKHPGKRPAHHQATLAGVTSDSIVYYVRRGDIIKIGTTADPVQRFRDLMPDEILAFEPGDVEQETLRHRQFDHLRCYGEHFRRAPELTEHIRQIRRLHGNPDPSWPSAVRSRTKRKSQRPDFPMLISHETITAAEATARFGIGKQTIRDWKHGSLLDLAGHDDRGHNLYYVEHLLAIRDMMAARRRRRAPSVTVSGDR